MGEKKVNKIDPKVAAQALEYLMSAQYISRKKLYFENFVRGIFFSIGSVVGVAVAVTLILWILTLFDNLPFIGDAVDAVEKALQN